MRPRYRWIAGVVAGASLAMLAGIRAAPRVPPVCPTSVTPALSSRMPTDVCIPDGFSGIAVNYFDDYSWRAFVALVWPAATAHRGVASTKSIAAAGPRVFESYKATWELFHSDGSSPEPAFDKYDAAENNPCQVSATFGDLTIGSASGIDDIGQAGIG